MTVPETMRWLFWEDDFESLEVERDANHIIPRVLEFGTLSTVHWLLGAYGEERIHRFLREVGHPELSKRTLAFWRACFKAENEQWATGPEWRRRSVSLWPD